MYICTSLLYTLRGLQEGGVGKKTSALSLNCDCMARTYIRTYMLFDTLKLQNLKEQDFPYLIQYICSLPVVDSADTEILVLFHQVNHL